MNDVVVQSTSDPREQPVARYELWAVVAITLLGAAARFAFPSAMAIEHFDEGVYASNLLFPDQGFRYPDRHLYAPSLVPTLIEWSIIFFGDKGIAPMLPSLLFGTLTIPLIWWVGRQWFGPLAGIAAASLLSFSDFHIAFSRSALTDVPLCFWLLLAVYLFERTFRDLSWSTAIFAGVTTGLAWWTKYNGWLPLAISLSGLMAWSLFARRDERHFLRRLSLWAVAAVTALVVWSPYWLSLPHGYAEVAQNHRQYVGGFAGWGSRLERQIESLVFWNGPVTWLSYSLGIAALVAFRPVPTDRQTRPMVKVYEVIYWFILAVAGTLFGNNVAFLGLAFLTVFTGFLEAAVAKFLPEALPTPTEQNPQSTALAFGFRFKDTHWLVVAWFVGLTVSVPAYQAYPRLSLPWFIASVLLAMSLFVRPDQMRKCPPEESPTSLRWEVTQLIGLAAILIVLLWKFFPQDSLIERSWQPRANFVSIGAAVRRDTIAHSAASNIGGTRAVLYVYAEPGLFFHLPSDGLAVQPAANLNFLDIEATRKLPTFLVTGPHAHRSTAFADEFAKRTDQFELIASYSYDASDFVRLDDVSATQLRVHREPLEVRLYRIRVSK